MRNLTKLAVFLALAVSCGGRTYTTEIDYLKAQGYRDVVCNEAEDVGREVPCVADGKRLRCVTDDGHGCNPPVTACEEVKK